MSRAALLWLIWILGTLGGVGLVSAAVFLGGDRRLLLIGQTTGAHHQFEISCETCHAAPALSEPKKELKALNETCQDCHEEDLKAANDSHPRKKFRDPRMASFWEKIDGRLCTSCHIEHRPEITRPAAVTLASDYCVVCHSEGEQDVRQERPSHADLSFDACASAGCHNYHDNTALYEDFLVKHAGQPWLTAPAGGGAPVLALAAEMRPAPAPDAATLEARMAAWVALAETVKGPRALSDAEASRHWAASEHAAAKVGCAACHAAGAFPKKQKDDAPKPSPEAIAAAWEDAPDLEVCASCHKDQAKTYRLGRHGMRGHPKIAKPRELKKQFKTYGWKGGETSLPEAMRAWLAQDPGPPPAMTVAEARLPMHAEAADRVLSCVSCHGPHQADTGYAAVEACASCHADEHSQAYFDSPHYALWKAERAGEAPAGSGVSCADCHMPKAQVGERLYTNHNQNDVLRPNEKMIRPVCMDCHGLGFAIDALADPDLTARNFTGRPAAHVESIDWATRRVKEGDASANQ